MNVILEIASLIVLLALFVLCLGIISICLAAALLGMVISLPFAFICYCMMTLKNRGRNDKHTGK
jgi:putative flippase GtrA